jgi:hypothetical protein
MTTADAPSPPGIKPADAPSPPGIDPADAPVAKVE